MNKGTQETMFSSKTSEWETPRDFYERLNSAFQFDLDPCAAAETAKCENYFAEEDDGLLQSWTRRRVFMNPPYGREIGKWVRKAYEEGQKTHTLVVCLLPARTDTKWWHDYCMKANEIYFVKGRLKFGNSKNAAPFPSAVVVFRGPPMKGMSMPHLRVSAMRNKNG
jgi:site-specific DNA-methyltransferase (adenine-specific)